MNGPYSKRHISFLKFFWIAAGLFLIGFIIYTIYVKSISEVKYTVFTITERYVSPKAVGRTYEYYVNGSRFTKRVTDGLCKTATIGSSYVLKYWVDDPYFVELYCDIPVPDSVKVPVYGWDELPKGF